MTPSPESSIETFASSWASRADGLLLIGGPDVDPATYDESPHSATYGTDPRRDAFEIALLRLALERAMPVLAICRGMQLLNVALGGTLDQHFTAQEGLIDHGVPNGGGRSLHEVALEPGSRVRNAMGTPSPVCSSFHHQAIGTLAASLLVTGRAEDGMVEAVELAEGWVVGVQWHPEDSADSDASQQRLFDELVSQARAYRARPTREYATVG
jgi:putative glutamine amidotransferase